MASDNVHNKRQVHKRKTVSPMTPHFLKRVSPFALRDNKLRIPKEFMLKYGKTISNPVIVKVPSGTKWKIGLAKYDGDLWFAEGWMEFAHFHSLENGQKLSFRYKGCSQFDLVIIGVIIGVNGLEIDYPVINSTAFYKFNVDDASS